MIKILISLVLTGCISTLFALLYIDKFTIIFAIMTLIQIIGFYIFNTFYENNLRRKAILLATEYEKQKSKTNISVSCPCSENNQQTIEMVIGDEKQYDCMKCGKGIKTNTNIYTVLATDPIYTKR